MYFGPERWHDRLFSRGESCQCFGGAAGYGRVCLWGESCLSTTRQVLEWGHRGLCVLRRGTNGVKVAQSCGWLAPCEPE